MMKTVLIAGGTGLIGKRLSFLLDQKGYRVIHLSRKKDLNRKYPAYQWDLKKMTIDADAIQQADYVINLAGAGIADKRWSEERKQLIIDSRVQGNQLLQQAFLAIKKPQAYVAAAAIGYYGDRGEAVLKETDAPSDKGFLAESCTLWEQSIQAVAQAVDTRIATIRVGIVLATEGGALEKMLLPFRAKVGTYFGDGSAIYSWIHLDDICGIFVHAIENPRMQGVYNGVAPNPVSNKVINQSIGSTLGGNYMLVPAPRFALRLAMGEMADVVLTGAYVSAKKILEAGYQFQFETIDAAMEDLLSD